MGVDLAADAKRTAVAWVEWSGGAARVVRLESPADDELVVEALVGADKAGIDCPFGWPDLFVDFVTAHRARMVGLPTDRAGRRNLAWRVTDQVVQQLTGLKPLSVSADRIGHTAMRCAGILAELARRGHPVDRSGGGPVAEVYPAVSLKIWGLRFKSYKRGAGVAMLDELVDAVRTTAPWLDLGVHEKTCRRSDDAMDAVVAALTARACAIGAVREVPAEHTAAARTEGWIMVPTEPLDALPA